MTGNQRGCLVCVCVAFLVAASDASAQITDTDAQVEMSVDVSITHAILDNEGNMVLPAALPTNFTVTRARRSGGWQTTVTYRKHVGAPTRAAAHPLDGARVEFDEASGATRVYDSTGGLNSLLSSDSTGGPRVAGGPGQWLDGLIARADRRSARSRDLDNKYGKAVGRVGRLDRFLAHSDGALHEVLADPASALPVEINTVQDGVLESHVVLDYAKRPSGAWVRRSIRAEQIVPGQPTHRSRLTVEFRNVTTGGR